MKIAVLVKQVPGSESVLPISGNQTWIDEGRMAQVDPVQLIFLIWSSTQHYADFQVQILMVENKAEYEKRDFDHAADFLTDVILRGSGLESPK